MDASGSGHRGGVDRTGRLARRHAYGVDGSACRRWRRLPSRSCSAFFWPRSGHEDEGSRLGAPPSRPSPSGSPRLVCPNHPAAAGLGWGGVVLAGGGVFIAGAEWEAKRPARLTLRFSKAAGSRDRTLHPHPTKSPPPHARWQHCTVRAGRAAVPYGPPVRDVSGGQPAEPPTGRAQRGSVRLAGDPAKARRWASS